MVNGNTLECMADEPLEDRLAARAREVSRLHTKFGKQYLGFLRAELDSAATYSKTSTEGFFSYCAAKVRRAAGNLLEYLR